MFGHKKFALTDWVGDYLQEVRGITVPRMLYEVKMATVLIAVMSCVMIVSVNVSKGDLVWAVFLLFLYSLWVPNLFFISKKHLGRVDTIVTDQSVLREYTLLAMHHRESRIFKFVRIFLWVWVPFSALVFVGVVIAESFDWIMVSSAFLQFLMVSMFILDEYVDCVIPRPINTRRKEQELPADLAFGGAP